MNFAMTTSGSDPLLVFGISLAGKVTALLVVGLIIQQVLARWRPASGSAVGNACLIGLLMLPVSALALPTVQYACLPAAIVRTSPRPPAPPVTDSRGIDPDVALLMSTPIREGPAVQPASGRLILPGRDPRSQDSSNLVSHPSPQLDASTSARTIKWLVLGLTAYAIIAVALLARLLSSLMAVTRLRNASPHVVDGPWWVALERCRRRLDIDRTVGLAWSPRVGVPIVLGWIRPTILLPASLTGIGMNGHVDAVLLHELSHVRRRDYPWNVLLHLVQAVYWPHPLVWLLGRAMAELRERACDDLCVAELGGAAVYREALLAVAAGLSHRTSPALGLAMARHSRLGARLARIEESRGDARCLPSLPARIAIATMAAAASITLGVIQLTRAEADEPAIAQNRSARVFHLRVVAADTRNPVPDADVRLWIGYRDEWKKTDAQGGLDIVHSTGPSDRDFGIDVRGEGRAMQRHHWGLDPNKPIPDGETIALQPGESLGGAVQDEQGRPIAGATIFLWSHNYRNRGSGSHELLYDLRAITGTDGRWRTSGAPATTGELLAHVWGGST